MTDRRRDLLILTGLLILAVVLRRIGLSWGLPEVFEEATPLKKAWEMWGWDRAGGVDLNPHFFSYPSFSIYLHFLMQGFLFVTLKVFGAVSSTLDFQVMYLVDRTPIFAFGRLLSLMLGSLTVVAVYRIGQVGAGRIGALLAAVLLAVNTYHVDQSQLITVDIPLTLFAMLSLQAVVAILARPTRGHYLLAGAAIGLATATKYTGALLVLPFLTAHLLALRHARRGQYPRPAWLSLFLGLALVGAVFVVASPYVLLDFQAFRASFGLESQHMQLGHFGLDETPSWQFYLLRLGNVLVGWPVLLAAGAALLVPSARRNPSWTIVLAVTLAVFLLPMGTWAMKADRYLLPVLPVILLLAGSGIRWVLHRLHFGERSLLGRSFLVTAILVLLAVVPLRNYPELWNRSRPDTRTRAMHWIEKNLPAGTFIVSEYYGPDLLDPTDLLPLAAEARERLLAGQGSRKVYAVQILPMFQTGPRRSAGFYDLNLIPDADYLIISSSVRTRYELDPELFRAQNAFYREVAARWETVAEFSPEGGTGPLLSVYRNPAHEESFAGRRAVAGPRPVAPSTEGLNRDEGWFHFTLGANYMAFGHPEHALASYRMGLQYRPLRPEIHRNLILGIVDTLLAMDLPEQAAEFVASAAAEDLDPTVAHLLDQLAKQLQPNPVPATSED